MKEDGDARRAVDITAGVIIDCCEELGIPAPELAIALAAQVPS